MSLANGDGTAMSNSRDFDHRDCPMKPDIEELIGSIKLLAKEVQTLAELQKHVTRWLLVVVCVIALGRSALDLGNSLLHDITQKIPKVSEPHG